MVKWAIVVGVVVLAGVGAFAVYTYMEGAQKDVESITSIEQEKMSADKVESVLKAGATTDFRTASQAMDSLETFEPAKQLEMLKVVLSGGDAALRMKAVQKLTALKGELQADAEKILTELSRDEKADADLAALVQKHLADRQLEGLGGGDRLKAVKAMLNDERPGFRLAGLNATTVEQAKGDPELLEALKKLAEDKNENVSMMATMMLDEISGKEEEEEEVAE